MIRVALDLFYNAYKDQYMRLDLLANDCLIEIPHFGSSRHVEFDITLPCEIQFNLSGKGPLDTVVDENGKVVEDKFIRIDWLSLQGIPVERWILESRLLILHYGSGEQIKTNYFGHNGQAKLVIPHEDIFDFWLDLQIDQ